MTKVVLTIVLVYSRIVYPYEYGFLDGPGLPPVLPAYDVETVACNGMPCLFYVPMDWRRLFKVFFSSFPEVPCSFPYVLLISCQMVTLIAVYDATFVVLGILVLGFHKYLLDGGVALEVILYAILTMYLFDTFGYSFCVRDDYLSYCSFVALSSCGLIVVLIVVVAICLTGVVVPCLCGWRLAVFNVF